MFNIQPLLLTQFSGPGAVGPFIVAYKLITLPQFFLILFLLPLVGAYGEARARSDWRWIRKTAMGSTGASLTFMLIAGCILTAYHEQIISWWVGAFMVADSRTVYWLCLYAVASGIATPLAVLLQGFERARDIAIFTAANGALLILGAVYLIPRLGEVGLAIAMTLSYVVVNCGYQVVTASKLLKSKTTGWSFSR
jgi:O-antigen/teichoic acid export membrane protein